MPVRAGRDSERRRRVARLSVTGPCRSSSVVDRSPSLTSPNAETGLVTDRRMASVPTEIRWFLIERSVDRLGVPS